LAEKAPHLLYSIENTFAENVREGIYDFSLERGVDMIIAYAHHYSFIEDLMHGSVAKDLAWHTRLPILFIHSDIRNGLESLKN
jgi:nucleotide-binding universal stress UspA family protein